MKKRVFPSLFLFLLSIFVFSFGAQANTKVLNAHEQVMVNKKWETTEALDQNKNQIDPKSESVSNFFGLAEYYPNGTFKITTFEGEPKLQGDWSFSNDGKTRTLTAKNDKNEVLFTRIVENVTVTPEEYTYRIYPEKGDETKYFDIVHKVKK